MVTIYNLVYNAPRDMHRFAFAGQYNVRGRTRSESETDLSYIHSSFQGAREA